jgi:endonuclease/exonuclease/phosphatase (EEP) superfamily protein YafD
MLLLLKGLAKTIPWTVKNSSSKKVFNTTARSPLFAGKTGLQLHSALTITGKPYMPYGLLAASLFLILSTVIPFIRDDHWVFRVFEYPRLQKLILNIALLVLIATVYFPTGTVSVLVTVALLANALYLCYLVFPFTWFGKKQLVNSSKPEGDQNIKILIANVYQYNRRANDYLQLIDQCDPDVVLMVETDNWWKQQMDVLSSRYPFQLHKPLENTYGMLLYSRLELLDGAIRFLVEDDIPSVEANVRLPSGQLVKLFCLHPKPPVPQESARSTERDKEILLVAEKARNCKLPVLVAGDLNDVAWSYTTELFIKMSGLLDPRRGRGFFNSFHARYPFLRFPLDHIFCSPDFSLSSIQRMNSCGSDHFPICINLQYDPRAEIVNDQPEPSQEDKELAKEKVEAEV